MTRRLRAILAVLAAVAALTASPVRAAEKVDLLLVLAADVSRSVNHQKFLLQREGYAAAIVNPRVLNAIKSGLHGRIALCFVEWSGIGSRQVVIDWTAVGDAESAAAFAAKVKDAPRSLADRTSISGAIDFAVSLIERAPFESKQRKIDISGDGTNNSGRDVTAARDEAVANGITINGLVILSERPLAWNPAHTNPPGGLPNYYRTNVIGGPGAFVMVAENFGSFGKAIVSKMVAEIAALAPRNQNAVALHPPPPLKSASHFRTFAREYAAVGPHCTFRQRHHSLGRCFDPFQSRKL